MASTREGLIAGLCQGGLTQVEAEAEVSQREAEAERIVTSEGHLGREAAVAKARALLFADEPIYVRSKPHADPKPSVDPTPLTSTSQWRRPQPQDSETPSPRVAAPISSPTRTPGREISSPAGEVIRAAGSSDQSAAPKPQATVAGIVESYWAWTIGGTPLQLLVGLGAPVAALLVVVMAFASSGSDGSSVIPNAISVTVAAGAQASSNQAGTNQADSNSGVAANRPPVLGSPTQFSPELVSYIGGIQPILYSYTLSLDSIAKLAAAPSLGNSTWTGQVNTAAQTIKDNNAKLRDLKPPSCVASAQAAMLKAAETMDKGAESLTSGIRSSNASTVSSAAAQLASAVTQVNQATIEITKARC
jgi:hypothetical protein